jgi:hypothetical protein
MKKQFIQCPECSAVELATVDTTTIPWWTYIHNCSCGYTIMESEWDPVKALSIKQPWAWLEVNGYKPIENRNTLKNFRGTFLIHAGMKFDKNVFHFLYVQDIFEEVQTAHQNMPEQLNDARYNYGGIIGYAEIYDCVTESDSPWFIGKYGLMIRNPKPLPFTTCKGKLSFFYPEIE